MCALLNLFYDTYGEVKSYIYMYSLGRKYFSKEKKKGYFIE